MGYELSMLRHNSIHGLLPFTVLAENGEWKAFHDITGQQSLDAWLETGHMDEAFFTELLRALDQVCRAFGPYLLDENKLCLAPDHVFIENGSRRFSFCFLPEEPRPVTESLRELLEYLLARIDHHDERLVEVAYAAYQKAAEGDCRIGELLSDNVPEREEAEILYTAEEDEDTEPDEMWEFPRQAERGAEKKPLWSGLFDFSKKKEPMNGDLPLSPEETEEIPQEPYEEKTTFLNPDEDYCKGLFRYTGNGEEQDFTIGETPFFIGTKVGVGGKLQSQAVSRLHAKITQAGEVYLIEDLNSTNGTFVNDTPVNYKSPITLHPKDQVRFADEEFVFF